MTTLNLDALKKLYEASAKGHTGCPEWAEFDEAIWSAFPALLARLEALEKVAEAARDGGCCHEHDITGHACGRKDLNAALDAAEEKQ